MALLDNAKAAPFSMQGAILSVGGTAPADEAIMGRLVVDLDRTWRAYCAKPQSAQTRKQADLFDTQWRRLAADLVALSQSDSVVSVPAL